MSCVVCDHLLQSVAAIVAVAVAPALAAKLLLHQLLHLLLIVLLHLVPLLLLLLFVAVAAPPTAAICYRCCYSPSLLRLARAALPTPKRRTKIGKIALKTVKD